MSSWLKCAWGWNMRWAAILTFCLVMGPTGCNSDPGPGAGQAQLEQELQQLREANQELQRLRSENQDLARLRKDNEELKRLSAQTAELAQLRQENERLRLQLQSLKQPRPK